MNEANGALPAANLFGGAGNDTLTGGSGADSISGAAGNDTINARDRAKDSIRCGSGKDKVTADKNDQVARDCETVTRR
jgi:Ca2+-binding RTX toxin-like protein